MRQVGTNSTRSSNGCWTCRIRKKKCDETSPVCFSCISLKLDCHGYGPKPKWMDNGPLQQEQASKIKHIVRQRSRSKRTKSTVTSDVLSLEGRSSPTSSLSASTDGILGGWSDNAAQTNIIPEVTIADSTSLDEIWWMNFFGNDPSASQLVSPDGKMELSKTNVDLDWDRPLLSTRSTETTFDSPPELVNACQSEGMWDDSESRDDFLISPGTAWSSPSVPSTRGQKDVLTSGVAGQKETGLLGLKQPTSNAGTEDMLFMHYLDQVFYTQYPFFDVHEKRQRGWLLSLLKGTKSAYHASLALSEHHLLSTQLQNSGSTTSPMKLRSKNSYYYLANQEIELSISESRWWDESVRQLCSLECLACLLQLLFLEIFAGGADNWQQHLRTASGFLPEIVQGSTSLIPRDSKSRNLTSSKYVQSSPSAKDSEAIDFLLSSFIALDIISCASTRSTPRLEIDHISTLKTLATDSRSFASFDNTIMILILEISQLDKWRKDATKSQNLSIIELAKRGSQIEERIHQKIADIDNVSSSRLPNSNRDSRSLLISDYADISRIFALSAIIYLHVVISGPQPELPEMREGVSRTLAAMQFLENKQMLANAVWAFCISGSMAVESQQGSFRELFSTAKATNSTVGSFGEAFKIMETCWDMRRSGSCVCDWVSAMDKLGRYILLQ